MTDTGNCVVPVDGNGADFLPLNDSDSNSQGTPMDFRDGDSSTSDVSMAADTDEEDAVAVNAIASQPLRLPGSVSLSAGAEPNQESVEHSGSLGKKRRSYEDTPDSHRGQSAVDTVKKIKLESSKAEHGSWQTPEWSSLPAELWYHIFTFCPPKTLGSLLLVNRLLNVYLDPSSTVQRGKPALLPNSSLSVLTPNAIWQISRRRFWPSMPSPLQDKAELQMWQLCLSTRCQHCGKKPDVSRGNDLSPWHAGPGHDGLAVIWQFATRICGACLLSKSIKEIDIFLSSSIPTALMAALPFIFVTQDLQAVSPAVVEKGQPPGVGQLTKLYWSSHVEEVKKEMFNVKAMGSATVEEWLKGLDGRGVERRNDATKWENWAMANGGLDMVSSTLYPGYQTLVPSLDDATADAPRSRMVSHIGGLGPVNSQLSTPSIDPSLKNGENAGRFRRSSSGSVSHPGRNDRTKEEVAALKAARKAEIERRVLALDPPIPLRILPFIPSFQAALHIITPLDDQGWEVLKPRLIAQSAEAEDREKEAAVRFQREADEKKSSNMALKEVREAEDADWDEIQAPVRARIAGFADEIIRDGWDDGDKVNRETCPKFAVDVLTYIRKRFYAEVAKDAAAARAAGQSPVRDPSEGPFTQKLTLENMKWIFEAKIKPHTERFRKEIFLCNGCEVTVRYYGFEGVIQHYAAKHTKALSIGNVVVYWRAEWPERPLFTSEPKSTKVPPAGHSAFQLPDQPLLFPNLSSVPTPVYGPPPWSEASHQASQTPYSVPSNNYTAAQGYQAGSCPHPDAPHTYATPQPQPPSFDPLAPSQPSLAPNYPDSSYGYHGVSATPFSHQYQFQLDEMARIARELWNATSNMRDALAIVRVQVVVYHLAKRFHAKFGVPLPLAMFIDGLSNHKDMRPVRNVNGLICRVCNLGIGGYFASAEERKAWSLPQLTSHFQSKHVEPFLHASHHYTQPPEWTVDMVMLPEPAAVANLHAAVRMDGLKYHLVNEAVPHLLNILSVPDALAPIGQSAWQGQIDHQQQSTINGEPSLYYTQADFNSETPVPSAGPPYQHGAGIAASYNDGQGSAYTYYEPLVTNTNMVLPVEDPAAAPVSAMTTNQRTQSRNDDSGRFHMPQGHHRSGRDQTARQSKKSKKKGGNNRNNSNNSNEEARKRTEEEEKMAEEEAEREADVIRAMWAADRANAANKSVLQDSRSSTAREVSESGSNRLAYASKRPSKANTPKQQQRRRRSRFQSRQPRDSPYRDERKSHSVARESSQMPPAPQGEDSSHRGHQLSNVIYIDDAQEDVSFVRDRQHSPPPSSTHDHQYNAAVAQQGGTQPRRSASPIYQEYHQPRATSQYRHRSPPSPRLRSQQPIQQQQFSRDPIYVDDDTRHDDERQAARRRPPPHQDDHHAAPPRVDGYHLEAAPPQGGDLIEIEIIEYRRPDGSIWIEERPLRRITGPEMGRYLYRDGSAHPPHPMSPPPFMAPSAYSGRLDMSPAPAPREPNYHRQPPPPPPPATTNEPILLSSSPGPAAATHYYNDGEPSRYRSAAEPDDYHRMPLSYPPYPQNHVAAARRYDPRASAAPLPPPPPRGPTVADGSGYDPRYLLDAPQHQARVYPSGGAQVYYDEGRGQQQQQQQRDGADEEEEEEEEEEEYDPRYPAGPPPPPPSRHMSALPPRPQRRPGQPQSSSWSRKSRSGRYR